MKKVQQEKTEAYKEFNRRRMQNEKSATLNSATHKKSAARKTVQHEKITTQKSGTWKLCNMKKMQHEKI